MRILFLGCILVLLSCSSKPEKKSILIDDTVKKIENSKSHVQTFDSLVERKIKEKPIDTCQWFEMGTKITPNGNFVEYRRFDKNKYRIFWGNKQLKRMMTDTFYCDAPHRTQPRFEQESKDYLMLRFGCGNPCWGAIYLPLNLNQKTNKIYYEYAFDLKQHLVVALDQDESKTFLIVHNLKTGNVQEIKLEPTCASAIPTYCLDSLSINGKYLYYRWFTDLDNHIKKEYTVKIH